MVGKEEELFVILGEWRGIENCIGGPHEPKAEVRLQVKFNRCLGW